MSNSFQDAYATYDIFDELAYKCVAHLVVANETVWKLLKYNDPDAWKKPNLTQQEKASLIYNGNGEISDYRVFMDQGQNDVWNIEACVVRIGPYSVFPENRSVGTLYMMFEVFAHYKINHLSNYRTRVDMITKEFIKTFNGANIGGLGLLNFSRMENNQVRAELGGQIPSKGRWLLMGVKIA